MDYEELRDGVIIKMMVSADNFSNKLVVTERNGNYGTTSQRVGPVIWFNNGKWRSIPDKVINDFKLHGFYLVSIPWTIRKPHKIDNKVVTTGSRCHVLHCVRKEHPFVKFHGKVGPISSFAPRVNDNNEMVRGYYVGYHWNGEESLEEIPRHFSGKLTLRGRKQISDKPNMSSIVRRLGVIVGKNGNCVGMEVRLTKKEEKNERRRREYHHTRPLILENGFYVFDGVFTWQPIHSNLERPIPLPTNLANPLIFLGEGTHLITSTKHMDDTNGEDYRRNVEICPSSESELVSIVDWNLFEHDFLL